MSDEKKKKIKSITIHLHTDQLNQKIANELTSIIKNNEGNADVFFNVLDTKKQAQVMLQCNDYHISVDSEMINFLNENNIEYQIN